TLIRPAQTYGGAGFVVPSVGNGTYVMKRLRQGQPIIIHGDGTSVWVACHRNDVANAFVNAIGNQAAFGQGYNVTGEEWMTFDTYWRMIAKALGAPEPKFVHIPTDTLSRLLPGRAEWCKENFMHNNIFDNTAAHRDLGFRYTVKWEDGIRSVIGELDKTNAIESCSDEPYYDLLLKAWDKCSDQLKLDCAGLDN
ncbi:MAG: epimerase, partial [Gorillibacterium sp.]|nr:epimerase [Gorillibacterium sp.]